jgi:hypothetical protein
MSKSNRNINDSVVFRANIVEKLDSIIKNEKISINVEKGIYNYSIKNS